MRLFVAVWPPAGVLDALEALDRPAVPGLRWTTRDQWHVTLRFLGRIDDAGPVTAALDRLAWSGSPPVAVAGPDTRRLGPSILALPVAGLDHLAACVVALTGTLGEPPPDRPFAGHVTLARARGGGRRGGRGGGRIGGPAGGGTALSAAFSAEWEVHEVTLVSSTLHPQGARYEIVSGYELA